jgi:hypothetical protein
MAKVAGFKNMPMPLLAAYLPGHIMLNLTSLFWFTILGQAATILRSKRDAVFGLPKMWRKRQRIQRTRVAAVSEIWRVLDKRLFRRL